MGMPIAGLLWSLATLYAKSDLVASLDVPPMQAFLAISVGGLALTFSLWVGFAAVGWAMVRAFGGRIRVLVLTTLISSAALPLWVGAPAAALWLNGAGQNALLWAVIALLSVALFLQTLASLLAAELSWPLTRAMTCVGAVAIFLGCFAYLST
ncbi:hypothetical protein [Roseovarius dicentrarchi]|uniref:hypothetical protein n=1 Tax=Roseovarius dicentrarchi TaxID=2250573 RepID=UPI0013966BCD|nr:hypothetical protein [Roseovarius dicentrarchi]